MRPPSPENKRCSQIRAGYASPNSDESQPTFPKCLTTASAAGRSRSCCGDFRFRPVLARSGGRQGSASRLLRLPRGSRLRSGRLARSFAFVTAQLIDGRRSGPSMRRGIRLATHSNAIAYPYTAKIICGYRPSQPCHYLGAGPPWRLIACWEWPDTMENLKYSRGRPARKSSVFKLRQFEL